MVVQALLVTRTLAEVSEDPAGLALVPTPPRVEGSQEFQVDSALAGVLPALHLAVDDPGVFALFVDVMDLGQVAALSEGGVQNVLHVDREHGEEALATHGCHRVAGKLNKLGYEHIFCLRKFEFSTSPPSVICVRPSIGSRGETTVGDKVQDAFVGHLLTAHEN